MEGKLFTTDYNKFKILDETTDEELISFEGAKLANKCLPGDNVKYDASGCQLVARCEQPQIPGTLELTSKTKYGMTSRGVPIYLFVPCSKAYPPFIVGCSDKDVSCNKLGVIKFDKWEAQFPRGNLQRILGPCGDIKAEEEALILQYSPIPTLKEMPELQTDDAPERKEITGFTFNIDPVGCKDVDDVITIENKSEYYQITITISDVAAFVQEMSTLDVVASTIGQTLYKDGQAIRPMLPHILSEDAFSLLPGKERLGISLSFKWKDSIKSHFEWFESKLVNNKTFTYEEAQSSEMPEIKILASVFCVEDSHDWIAEAMKLYNLEAAKLLVSSGVGILRTHRAPDLERLAKYTSWDSSLAALAAPSAQYIDYQPGINTTHFGLDTDAYCHITSPIRRYADLMNQRLLKQIIRGNKESLYVTTSIHELNVRAKAAKAFERDLCYMRALSSNSNHCVGRILDIIKKEELVKLRILVSEWKRVINVTYTGSPVEDGWLIKSKDEKTERLVKEGDLVGIDFAANLTARRWKEKLVISLT